MKTKKHTKKVIWWWIAIPMVIVIFGLYVLANRLSQQQSSSDYVTYHDPVYGFTVEYPENWDVRRDTHVFENGDIVAFQIKGSTQKRYTEFIDGARFIIAKPFTIDTDLALWMKEYFSDQATFSKSTLTQYSFEMVEECSNLGCMRYYFTPIGDQVYGVALFAEGTSVEKAAYENALIHMFKSLRFTDLQEATVTEEMAVAKVKLLSEVVDYLERVPNGLVAVNGEEDTAYMVQVYEIKDGHTATFNWYRVDKKSGDVEVEF